MSVSYEIANFGSTPSRLDPESLKSWQQMQQIHSLSKEMGVDFPTAFVEYQHRLTVGLPVPAAPSVSFAQSNQSTATVAFGDFGEVEVTNLDKGQRSAVTEISGIAKSENVSFEEATRLYIERHPERY